LKSTSWKDIAELVGIAAIVASLLFVGLQMRQSHAIALSDSYQQRSAMTAEAFLSLSENDAALAALVGAIPGDTSNLPEGVEPEEYLAFQYWFIGMMAVVENVHYQYQTGFMTEEGWLRSRNGLKRQIQINALVLPQLQAAKRNMSQPFLEEVERIEAEVREEKAR
jgi:hypothetical protein